MSLVGRLFSFISKDVVRTTVVRCCQRQCSTVAESNADEIVQTVDDFRSLIRNESDEKMLHLILLEVASTKENGGPAPSMIPEKHMAELLKMKSIKSRMSYYRFLFVRDLRKQREKEKKDARYAAHVQRQLERKNTPRKFSNTIYPFIRDQTMKRQNAHKLLGAALFGQRVIFDCSWHSVMRGRATRSCTEQLQIAYSQNRLLTQPFDLTFSDVPETGRFNELLLDAFPDFEETSYFITKSSRSFQELYPDDKFVYLTPDSPNILNKWDWDATYIVGALVDLGREDPLSLNKAMSQKIGHARLPVQESIWLKSGAKKALNIDIMVNILAKFRDTNDWEAAFKAHLPKRYIQDSPIPRKVGIEEKKMKIHAYRKRHGFI